MPPARPAPPLTALLAYGPGLLVLLLGSGAWLLPVAWQAPALTAGWLWSCAILLFLAGVTRGLSFFSPGGPHAAQLVVMAVLFLLGCGALVTPLRIGLVLLVLGYATVGAFDPPAAQAGLAPAYFARLRVRQVAAIVAGLLLMLLRTLRG